MCCKCGHCRNDLSLVDTARDAQLSETPYLQMWKVMESRLPQ